MKRIDTPTKATDLHGPGKHGFKDGNPLTGDPATTLSASMFNHLQEEVARTIEAGGGTLDPSNFAQLAFVLGVGECSLGPTGYLTLPGNAAGRVLLQWGTATFLDTGSALGEYYSTVETVVAFPRAFSVAPFVVLATGGIGEGVEHVYATTSNGAASATIRAARIAGAQGGGETGAFYWIAIGI